METVSVLETEFWEFDSPQRDMVTQEEINEWEKENPWDAFEINYSQEGDKVIFKKGREIIKEFIREHAHIG